MSVPVTHGNERFRYKLTLEVDDFGQRSFSSTYESHCQTLLATQLCFDVKRMMTILEEPPLTEEFVRVMEALQSPFGFLAFLSSKQYGDKAFEDCIRLTVDVGLLCHDDDKTAAEVRGLLEYVSWAEEGNTDLVNPGGKRAT